MAITININKTMSNKINKSFIKNELNKLFKTDYYGTEEQIFNENILHKECKTTMKWGESIEEWYLRIYDNIK
jgi:hypothetical protein